MVDNEDYDLLKAMSQHCVKSCFHGLVFCNPTYGIFGAQPGDMLLMLNLGAIKEVIILMLDCLTPSQKIVLDAMGHQYNQRL